MTQFIRPAATGIQQGAWYHQDGTTLSNFWVEVDEITANDSDYVYCANGGGVFIGFSLSSPLNPTYISGICTVRYRIARTNNGVLTGTGSECTVTASVFQSSTQIATDTAKSTTGSWTTYSFTFNSSAITGNDWTNVSLRFTAGASSGSPSVRRGAGISWAEIEVPDAATTRYVFIT